MSFKNKWGKALDGNVKTAKGKATFVGDMTKTESLQKTGEKSADP